MQQINITQLDKNGHHVVAGNADIVGIAEHKLTRKQIGPWKKVFADAKKMMVCSPSDYAKKVPQAGVAIVGGRKVRVVDGQAKTENFQKCIDEGRAIKCYIDG